MPIWTKCAPANINSITSSTLAMPPIPIIGISILLKSLWILAIAIGLIAGPDKPPIFVYNLGFLVFINGYFLQP